MGRHLLLGLASFSGVCGVVAACGGPEEFGQAGKTCFRDNDCGFGLVCAVPQGQATRVCTEDVTGLISRVDAGVPGGSGGVAGASPRAGRGGALTAGGSSALAGKGGLMGGTAGSTEQGGTGSGGKATGAATGLGGATPGGAKALGGQLGTAGGGAGSSGVGSAGTSADAGAAAS